MKKKFCVLIFSCLLAVLLTSCDEILSVVTVGKNGEKVVSHYVSVFGDTVYDETVSFNSWRDVSILNDEPSFTIDDLLFKIENKKDKIVVLGDKDGAFELSFFDGGYKYTVFMPMDAFSDSINELSEELKNW